MVKQVSHTTVTFLDQSGRSKENFLDLKCGRRGVLELEGDLMQWKEVCFAGEMSNKQLLQQVYTYLKIKQGWQLRELLKPADNGEEHG